MSDQQTAQPGELATFAATSDQVHIGADTIDRITELAHASVSYQAIGGTTHLIFPEKYQHKDITSIIEKAQPNPNRKTGTTVLNDTASFLQFVRDQAKEATGYIFADIEARSLTAVFNHQKDAVGGWKDHQAIYRAELSREATTWINNNKRQMEQEEFAIFLEDNIADIAEPSGDMLLTVALTLQAKTEVAFASARRLDNGQVQFLYNETINATAGAGSIEIPREFTLGIRIFKNGDGLRIKARLKYRLTHQRVKFWYELDRVEDGIELCFADYIEQVSKESGYTVLLGKP
ncbi:hypothetical protein UNDYM_1629 [Undibacterium sp. YM2]|uniref:DUF2303 family protein n=1 Tax=Undibacterium sp. YM2 TaxID=2058625 RepID=UPI001331E863|nr:DUF2303 family protein [Undibacterium sp. YM2]BBB65882.1 hypothetical protein UNDYM_1629 [Undibacterium sp. YM2]